MDKLFLIKLHNIYIERDFEKKKTEIHVPTDQLIMIKYNLLYKAIQYTLCHYR